MFLTTATKISIVVMILHMRKFLSLPACCWLIVQRKKELCCSKCTQINENNNTTSGKGYARTHIFT